jgi:hypothetical protein
VKDGVRSPSRSREDVEGVRPVRDDVGQAAALQSAALAVLAVEARSRGGVEVDGRAAVDGVLRALHAGGPGAAGDHAPYVGRDMGDA